MTKQEFIEVIAKCAIKYAPQFNIKVVSPIIAQAILESNWGTSYKAAFNNYFGLKYRKDRIECNSGYFEDGGSEQNLDGSYRLLPLDTSWYAFDNIEMGVLGYFQFINIDRYKGVKGVVDPKKYLEVLKTGGYATSQKYVENNCRIIEQYNLTKFDTIEGNDIVGKYLIALDDGHGMETAGKRTPKLPDGSVMKENEFNRVVVNYLDAELKRCGFDTLLVAPTDEDTPLSTRVAKANNANAKAYISIHANAYDGSFGGKNPEGVETFYFNGSNNRKELATEVHSQLITGTKQISRGIKPGNHLYVIRWTHMPAILIEAGFMDNPREAELLRSDSFRREVAREIAIGICNYFEVAYVAEDVTIPGVEMEEKNLYRVQCGAFKNKANAESSRDDLIKKGYQAFVTYISPYYKVQVGAFSVRANAEKLSKELTAKGINNFIV